MDNSSARTRILTRIRQALDVEATEREYSDDAFKRLLKTTPKAHSRLTKLAAITDVFIQQAQAAGANIIELDSIKQVPVWLRRTSFSRAALALANQPSITTQDWSGLNLDSDYAEHGEVGVVQASMAAAETGTVVLHSYAVPSGLLFLVDRLVILLPRAHIKARYEDLWHDGPQQAPQGPPRAVHLITGPSRTADVEQTIQIGAHGPREVFVIILAGE